MQVDTSQIVGPLPRTSQPGAVAPRVVPVVSGRGDASDSIHFSDAARSHARQRTEQMRSEKIERIRLQIAEGTYVTDERVSAAAAALARALSD